MTEKNVFPRILQHLMEGCPKMNALQKVEEEFNKKSSGNLNVLTTAELDLQKEEMDVLFVKNQVKPDEPEFEYDKQKDFEGEKIESGWDEAEGLDDNEQDFWESSVN